MTIRDIAIAIGFEIDDASLKKAEKTVEKAKKRWEKTLKSLIVEIKLKVPKTLVQSGSAPVAKPPSPTEAPNTAPPEEQENITDEILNNQRKINDEVDEQAAKQRRVNEEEKKGKKKHTEEQVKKKRITRDLLNGIWGKSKQVTNETKKQTAAEQKHQQELKQTKAAYQQIFGVVRSTMGKLIGTLGLGFSLVQLKQISEEFNGINDRIRDATRGRVEQSAIQQQILQAANASRTSYGDTAKFVGNLVQENKELFGSVEEAANYAQLTSKLFKAAGKSNEETAALQEAINKSFAKGKVDSETISQLLENAPEAVKLLEKELGVGKERFEEMASQGQISLSALKNAIVNNADTINASFNELDMNLSDALLNIRNQWGLWVDKVNSQYGLTKKLSAFLVNFFSKLLGWLDKAVAFIDKIADKVGGMENLLKLLAMAAGSIWLALNAGKILSFFKSLSGLLTTANLKTLALVAVIMLIALAIDDLIHFMRGDASVIGEFLKEMGIDADDAREKIQKGIDSVLNFVQKAGSVIKKVIGWLGEWVRAFVDGISAAIGGLIDLFELCKQGWEWLKETPLGKFVGKVGDAVGSAVNSGLEWLQKGADWLTKDGTVQAATASASAGAGNKTNNITIQNHINNTFNGSDREMQQKGAEMTGQAVSDSSEELTKAMATGR